jgi:hypothetical protein
MVHAVRPEAGRVDGVPDDRRGRSPSRRDVLNRAPRLLCGVGDCPRGRAPGPQLSPAVRSADTGAEKILGWSK